MKKSIKNAICATSLIALIAIIYAANNTEQALAHKAERQLVTVEGAE